MKKTIIITIVIALIVLSVAVISESKKPSETNKIGVISPLSGDLAYWGESSIVGINLAKEDLAKENIKVDFIIEDGQVDSKLALSAAQKLVNQDKVRAIYSEFNPAAIAVSSFLKGKGIIHIYDAAVESPLYENNLNFKTYLNYRQSCKETAQYIKDRGIKRVGVLKINLEFGDLCLQGIKEVFGDNTSVESYNYGSKDFKTSLTKLKQDDVEAVFHASFQPETITSIKDMDKLKMGVLFVGLSETISPSIINELPAGNWKNLFFGLPDIQSDLRKKIDTYNKGPVANYNASALAYLHAMQLGRALNKCSDTGCALGNLTASLPDEATGFKGYTDRQSQFSMQLSEYMDGKLEVVK